MVNGHGLYGNAMWINIVVFRLECLQRMSHYESVFLQDLLGRNLHQHKNDNGHIYVKFFIYILQPK